MTATTDVPSEEEVEARAESLEDIAEWIGDHETPKYHLDDCECRAAASNLRALRAALTRAEGSVDWILNDARYKAPEQVGPTAQRWIERLEELRRG